MASTCMHILSFFNNNAGRLSQRQ